MTILSTRTSKLAALVIAALATQACGGDDGGGGGDKAAADKKAEAEKKKKEKEAKKKAAKKKKEEPVSYITALEDVVRNLVDKDGKPLVKRPRLTNHDFMSTENRDPFRSFVMPQVAADGNATPTGPIVPTGPITQPTAACAKLELVATSYSIDDLDLIGVIRKGSRRFAMFRDTRGVGHLVDKGKCLGREKGKIVEVGDSLVCYEVTPEQPLDATAVTPPVKKCVALYPNEITDTGEEEIDLSARPDDLAPPIDPNTTPAPPPTGPPTGGPPGGPP